MTVLEVVNLVASVVVIAGAPIAVLTWWKSRPSVVLPYYPRLKENQKAQDPKRWVQIQTVPGLASAKLYAGVVVELKGKMVTLDHPQVGNQALDLSPTYRVVKKHYPERDWDGWVPRLDSER